MSQLASIFANNLLPVFLVAGSAYIIARRFSINPRTLSQVSFYLFSPSLIFNLILKSELSGGDILQMLAFSTLSMLIAGGVAGIAGMLLHFERRTLAAVLLTTMFLNAGNYGLPVILFAFGESALSLGTLYFITMAILAYTLGVIIASMGTLSLGGALKNLFRVPVLYGVILALVFKMTGVDLPLPLARTTELLAGAAIPAMLVLMGLQFPSMHMNGRRAPLVLSTTVRLLISPLIAFALALWMGLDGPALQAGVLQAGMPTAVITTVLATEFDTEPAFVTAVVFITTVLSPLTLTPLLAFLGG